MVAIVGWIALGICIGLFFAALAVEHFYIDPFIKSVTTAPSSGPQPSHYGE